MGVQQVLQTAPAATRKALKAVVDGRLHRIFGRFAVCRRLLARWRALADRGIAVADPAPGAGMFAGLSAEACVAALRRDGIWQGLRLPADSVREIAAFARREPCGNFHGSGHPERFLIAELRDGHTPSGRIAPVVDVDDCTRCPAVEAVAGDPVLFDIARRYLGFRPRRVERRLFWSPRCGLADAQRRRAGQTIDFHYDIEAAGALYVFFYIEGGLRDSGAHVAIAGSHRAKPLRLALAPSFQSAARLFAHYPRASERMLDGGPGAGFIEDPYCYHRALAPRDADRLVLQLRLS